ncbi:MAG: hypothetical protein WCR52_20970 [Bacteroidota bacterium]
MQYKVQALKGRNQQDRATPDQNETNQNETWVILPSRFGGVGFGMAWGRP